MDEDGEDVKFGQVGRACRVAERRKADASSFTNCDTATSTLSLLQSPLDA
jgi:hypothetical protein